MSKAEELSRQYRDFREQCGIKNPVMLNEIEVAYEEGYYQAEEDIAMPIEYVHELQQAMRIMGCDKEIEL